MTVSKRWDSSELSFLIVVGLSFQAEGSAGSETFRVSSIL
jgi:hypothetical protein